MRWAMHSAIVGLWVACAASAQVDYAPLMDSAKHWQDRFGRDRQDTPLDESAYVAIAENMLRFQNSDGGWPKDLDYRVTLDKETVRALRGGAIDTSTLDNHTTFTQVEYLAQACGLSGDVRFRDAAARGIQYILNAQNKSGGWRGSDVDAITFNDGVMVGVMKLLRRVSEETEAYNWVDDSVRASASTAFDRAIACTLHCQIVVNGVPTGWCQQHSHDTYAPVDARSYELASMCALESAEVVLFLMSLTPRADVVRSVEAAVAWFKSAAIGETRIEVVAIAPVRFDRHTATRDVLAVHDPSAPPVWARYYEIGSNRPFFCNRDGIKVYSLAEVDLERRSGYRWYGYDPQAALNAYPAYRAASP